MYYVLRYIVVVLKVTVDICTTFKCEIHMLLWVGVIL